MPVINATAMVQVPFWAWGWGTVHWGLSSLFPALQLLLIMMMMMYICTSLGFQRALGFPRVLAYFACSLYNVQYLFLWEPEVGKSIQFRNLYKIGSTNQDACRAQAGA